MERHFTIRYPDDYGEMWFNKDNLMLCINSYCENKDRYITASDITDGLNQLRARVAELEAEVHRLEADKKELAKQSNRFRGQRDKAMSENEKLRKAMQTFSDLWKYYDGDTINGLDQLRAALREV